MYLTISKRFEFSASYHFGRDSRSGLRASNFVAYFLFHGPVDPLTGMMINISEIKERVGGLLESCYDHKNLNHDSKPFDSIPPTVENIARQLLLDTQPLFSEASAQLVACHLSESESNEATAYADGNIERHRWLGFSAARRTWSPNMSESENYDLFGPAARLSGHGHYYRLRLTLAGSVDPDSGLIVPEAKTDQALKDLFDRLDHRNLSTDLPELKKMPMTTEGLARWILGQVSDSIPVKRVCLWENPNLYAEYHDSALFRLGIKSDFQAAHRLHSQKLSDEENVRLYDKCNNPAGHGHRYAVEACLSGELDERSGILCSLELFKTGLENVLSRWDGRHLDRDTGDFKERPSSSENIISILHPRLESELCREIARLRLWETANNRFTIRRDKT